ncbi:MAG: polysaccharide pyruvyl transferase family protein [Bacteroidaceae bacterium]|nr:polysaccharide pyruvyl transferase family protein [Bacteroidaceae bacterium]
MKIGIVTFWQTRDNYGQMLQCWALQHQLLAMGHEPFLIRYRHTEAFDFNFKISIKNFIKNFIRFRFSRLFPKRTILPPLSDKDLERDFESFKSKYLFMSSNEYLSIKDLRRQPPEADCYIVGSDQVWSKLLYFDESKAFFLDFGKRKVKRISYAASFSFDAYPKTIQNKLAHSLSAFNSISVRESTGVKICKDVGYEAELVVDPTLLLQFDEYLKIFSISNAARKGIYVYVLNIRKADEIGWEELKNYAERTGEELKITPASGYFAAQELFEEARYEYSQIPQWISNIANARLVVTTSFHGIVFCLLAHTPFVYVPLKGEYSRGNNRVLDLFDYLGVKSGIYNEGFEYSTFNSTHIDWANIDKKIDSLRRKSLDFLESALKKTI